MSELEATEVVESPEVEAVEAEEQADLSVVESAPTEVEQSTENEAEVLRKQIAEKAFKERQSRRRAEELEERLKKLEADKTPKFDGVIPPMPDAFDDDFEQKIKAREDAVARKAQADYDAMRNRELEAETQRKRERDELENQQKLQAEFRQNATSLGVDQEVLANAARTVIEYGITPDIENAIMADKEGALMLQHLASNPLVLSDLVDANPLKAGMMLAEIKSKSLSLKPKPSSAPDPATIIKGRGAALSNRDNDGTTYE